MCFTYSYLCIIYIYIVTLLVFLKYVIKKRTYLKVVSLGRYGIPLAFISLTKLGGKRPATDIA